MGGETRRTAPLVTVDGATELNPPVPKREWLAQQQGTGETTVAEHDEQFAQGVRHVRAAAEAFLAEHFGERCKDFCAGCECCERWAALDRLTAGFGRDGPIPLPQEPTP